MKEFSYIEIQQPIGVFYYCAIPATYLLKIVRSSPRSKSEDGVQRDLQQERINNISKYCSDPDAVFPTPIVVSVDDGTKVTINEEQRKISFPDEVGEIGDVIDGQHRLWGIEGSKYAELFVLPVAFMFGLTLEEKAYIFSTINSNQRKVNPSLIYDLFEVTKTRSPQKTVHELARVMNNTETSPFYNRLKMLGKKTKLQNKATLSQGTFAKTLLPLITRDPDEDSRLIKRKQPLKEDIRCPFRAYFIDGKDDVIAKILLNCFSALKNVFPEEWESPQNNILWKTTGCRALIYSLPSIIRKGHREKILTQKFFEACFMAFKDKLEELNDMPTSQSFPGGGEQNQKKLAMIIVEAVAELDIVEYEKNLVQSPFLDFLKGLGELNIHEIYDLAQALQWKTDSLVVFKCKKIEEGKLKITYPFYDASTVVTKEEAVEDLKYLEDTYMDGLDAESWYGYRRELDKELDEELDKNE